MAKVEWTDEFEQKLRDKPNGCIVYTIFTGGTYIDMNVIEKED